MNLYAVIQGTFLGDNGTNSLVIEFKKFDFFVCKYHIVT
jgi:hypothetical protein